MRRVKDILFGVLILFIVITAILSYYLLTTTGNLRHNCNKVDIKVSTLNYFDFSASYCSICSDEINNGNVVQIKGNYCSDCGQTGDGVFCKDCGDKLSKVNINIKDTIYKSLDWLHGIIILDYILIFCIVVLFFILKLLDRCKEEYINEARSIKSISQ